MKGGGGYSHVIVQYVKAERLKGGTPSPPAMPCHGVFPYVFGPLNNFSKMIFVDPRSCSLREKKVKIVVQLGYCQSTA